MNQSYTAILSLWRRPHNLRRQISALFSQTRQPNEVRIWAGRCRENWHCDLSSYHCQKILLDRLGLGVYGRFLAAVAGQTEFVMIIDDDMIPGERYVENCQRVFKERGRIIAAGGVDSTQPRYRSCIRFGWETRSNIDVEVDIGLNGWYLKREWLKYLWAEPTEVVCTENLNTDVMVMKAA